jgi:hypothetical protein
VFASKRDSGVFGRLYFAHVDADGQVAKPFLLPQEDPAFYDTNLNNFNAPEFAVKAVSVEQRAFLEAIYSSDIGTMAYDADSPGRSPTPPPADPRRGPHGVSGIGILPVIPLWRRGRRRDERDGRDRRDVLHSCDSVDSWLKRQRGATWEPRMGSIARMRSPSCGRVS